MADDIIIVEIEFDGKKGFANLNSQMLKDSLKLGEDVADNLTKSFSKNILKIGGVLASALAAVGGARLFGAAISESIEFENAINNLAISLSNAGRFSQQALDQQKAFADQLSRTTKLTDDEAVSLLSLANNFAKTNEQAELLTRTAVDLAAATGKDVTTALNALGASLSGNAGQLGKLVPQLKEIGPEALKSGEALRILAERFGGTAEKQLNTFDGALTSLRKSFDDLLQSIGNLFVRNPAVIKALQELGKVFQDLSKFVSTAFNADQVRSFILGVISGGIAITRVVDGIVSFITKSFLAAGDSINVIFTEIALAVVKTFGFIASKLSDFKILPENAKELFKKDIDSLTEKSNQFADTLIGRFEGGLFQSQFGSAITERLTEIGNKVAETSTKIVDSTATIKNAVQELADPQPFVFFAALLDGAKNNFVNTAQSISKILSQGVNATISNSLQRIGASLVEGSNAFKDFGKMVLGIVGDMAIQIGNTLIAIGIGIDSLKASLATLSGGIVIAAGVALVVLGGLLKSLSGAGLGAGGGASGGAGGVGGGVAVSPSELTAAPETEQQKAKTEVAINLQGVIDKRGAAEEIANILNEYFDSNDGFVGKVNA